MAELPFKVFDADNHYYEATDAFTRHIDPAMKKRCMQWANIDGKTRLLVGGKINRFIPNPTFDPVSKPGALQDFFRGRNKDGVDVKNHVRRARPHLRAPRVPQPGPAPGADGHPEHRGGPVLPHPGGGHGAGFAPRSPRQ